MENNNNNLEDIETFIDESNEILFWKLFRNNNNNFEDNETCIYENNNEILFWKLFRNIVIYKKIFSFMDSRFSINYDSMSSISNLINNNHFNIIKEKVYRNCRYLHYTSNNCKIEPSLLFVKLFSNIKDDDYRLYRNFLNSDNCYYDSHSTISKALILSKKLEINKLYINEFDYKPTETDLFYSIIIGLLCFFNIIDDHSYEGYEKNHHQIAIDDLVYSFTNNPYAIDKDPGFNETQH
ncbi:hypothetical protein DDB_G0271466 [Dictyostelium discoideum AX4]|uniref:Uncharacterized protein n=1 Tax=Dictyostelium discoideum TaxID=44689 RepID=Q55B22_DICDI|nr:hypothetical protein DDB_G0271466 [Dictyostelium discoideum AX4]EAL71863.1 hypothetical protein DDB_G0271466 [Dictyostelium discoideum AX4]|eukprot:XP_645790.1 hypothetical protein DDB_G0271466 [Dictyostelium discoideum AX4]